MERPQASFFLFGAWFKGPSCYCSGSLAIFAAIRGASSFVSSLAAGLPTGLILVIDALFCSAYDRLSVGWRGSVPNLIFSHALRATLTASLVLVAIAGNA